MHIQFTDGETDEALLEWLRTLDEPTLARVLARRPDALDRPWPRRIDDLARRLGSRSSVWLALRYTTTPGFELLGAIKVCAGLRGSEPVTVTRLAELVDGTTAQVEEVLRDLSELALAWITPDGHVRVADALSDEFGYGSYGLGPPLRELASQTTVDRLKRINSKLRLPTTGRKQQLVDALLEFFADADSIRGIVEQAPADTRELLFDLARNGSYIGGHVSYLFYLSSPRPRTSADAALAWAIEQGLIWPSRADGAVLPLEAGLTLRGRDYRLPFTPTAPRLETTRVEPDSVASESAAAAMRIVDRVNSVLTSAATSPIPLLKSGGVGVRAVRGLAKSMGTSTTETRLAVELAGAAGFLLPAEPPEPEPAPRGRKGRSQSGRTPAPEGLVPTEEASQWRTTDSSGRLRSLLRTWWELDGAPLAEDKTIRSVLGDEPSAAYADVRHRVIGILTTLDESTGVTGGMGELLSWYVPLLTPELVGPLVDATLAEAELLGVTNSGAAGELARTLHGDTGTHNDAELAKTTDSIVAAARTSALFGSDLTAIVTGTADTELAALLDTAADREAQGSAFTWRFSPGSVRRAFDNGETAEGLLEQLRGVAQGELPQPLVYLINDAARKHGQVGVTDVRCVIVGEDTSLLAEIAAHRKLVSLGLHQLAPTVLAARSAAADTLTALRNAGYAPVPRELDGSLVVARDQPAPQSTSRERQDSEPIMLPSGQVVLPDDFGERSDLPAPDPAEHAARLTTNDTDSAQRVTRGELIHQLRRLGGRYRDPEWHCLALRLEFGFVTVNYRDADGRLTQLRISEPEWHGDALNVWSIEDDDYRTLELDRITPTQDTTAT